jgi:hypothetical protein
MALPLALADPTLSSATENLPTVAFKLPGSAPEESLLLGSRKDTEVRAA